MPTLSRRTIVVGGLSVIGASALGVTAVMSRPGSSTPEHSIATANADLARSRFTPYIGTTFTASSEAASFPVILHAVEDLLPVRAPEDEQRFNLLFTAVGVEPPQGIYTLRHSQADSAVLFLSAVGADGAQRRLQAVVDRSV